MPERLLDCDVLVAGGGPAGMAAACCASQAGRHVWLVDDNPAPGGQIWRGEHSRPSTRESASWFKALRQSKVRIVPGARIFGQSQPNVLLAETADGTLELRYKKLVVATGARERFLPFPGWTLPNVTGAGGLQALVKSGMAVDGKNVVVAGSGPLLIAVATYLREHGARLVLIAEQCDTSRLARFLVGLLRQPAKFVHGIDLRRQLSGVPHLTNCWPVSAAAEKDKLTSVTLRHRSRTFEVPCDYLACGFYLVPNLELPMLLGCATRRGAVQVNDYQETSVPDVYCAGESTGIGGLELSLVEGQVAGYAAAGMEREARAVSSRRSRYQRFAELLNRTFTLREELKELPTAETIVCRCEDVTFARLRSFDSWRAAKLQTRCGMGPCQGRICGAACEFLLGWGVESVRPPIVPVRLESLAGPLSED